MKKYNFFFFILLLIVNCSDEDKIINPIVYNSEYFPMQVGNTWFYNVDVDTEPWIKRVVEKKITIENKIYFIISDSYGYQSPLPHVYTDTLRVDKQGRIFKYEGQVEYLWFDFTLDSGSTYHFKNYTVKITKVDSMQVDAGTFTNCIKLFFDIPVSVDDEIWYIFAPQTGLIRQAYGEGPTLRLNSCDL